MIGGGPRPTFHSYLAMVGGVVIFEASATTPDAFVQKLLRTGELPIGETTVVTIAMDIPSRAQPRIVRSQPITPIGV